MSLCKHTGWLRLRRKGPEAILEISDRPLRLLKEIQDPSTSVGVVLLIGGLDKSVALTNLAVRSGDSKSRRSHGEIHLLLSSLSDDAGRQVIIADGDVPTHNRLPTICKPPSCHEIIEEPFSEIKPRGKIVEVADDIYHRVLAPHVDVVCLFVADVGGIEHALQRLAAWLSKGPSSTSPVCPQFVLVVDNRERQELQVALHEMACNEMTTAAREITEHVRVVTLPTNHSTARHSNKCLGKGKSLQRELLNCLKASHEVRKRSGYLFSARHIARFLCAGAVGATVVPWEPVDFIATSQEYNNASSALATSTLVTHLRNFLEQMSTRDTIEKFAIPVISSSFILNQYSPDSHAFHPRDVFRVLFRDACVQVQEQLTLLDEWTGQPIIPTNFVDLLEVQMIQQVDECRTLGSSISLHRQQLSQMRAEWSAVQCESTCFSCLRRRPRYALQGCIHSVCEYCVHTFHHQSEEDPWNFCVDQCHLCGADTLGQVIRMTPVTATPRVLSIDGGGARARAPLENLHILEKAIRLPYPVQRNFDFVIGTSSGAMIACGLFLKGWSVEDCIQYIDVSMLLAFQRHLFIRLVLLFIGGFPFLPNLVEFLVSLVVDSKYSAERLEMLQRDVYGSSRSIMDSPEANKMGVQVAITLTTTRDAKTNIVTNYNGIGDRDSASDYHALRPEIGLRNIPLWKFLLCATAAPYYYPPYYIPGVGEFQDGGVMYNNPVSIGLQEVTVLGKDPEQRTLVVSLGTGSVRESDDTRDNESSLSSSFPARLYRVFCKQMAGHCEARGQDNCPNIHRLNIEFDGKQPPLDDVKQSGEIARMVRETALSTPAITALARELRAEQFLFELDPSRPPQYINGIYECFGYISCRLRAGDPALKVFMQQLIDNHAFWQCGRRVLPAEFQCDGGMNGYGNFYQEVAFHMPNRQGLFKILLQDGPGKPCNISGSPFTLERLMRQQKLEPWFGTPCNSKRRQLDTSNRFQKKQRRVC